MQSFMVYVSENALSASSKLTKSSYNLIPDLHPHTVCHLLYMYIEGRFGTLYNYVIIISL